MSITRCSSPSGVPGVELSAAQLERKGHVVELLQYTAHADWEDFRPRPSDIGSIHIAVMTSTPWLPTTGGSPTGSVETATIRRTLIGVPARIASSARRLTLHLPTHWPWQTAWTELLTRACGPPGTATP